MRPTCFRVPAQPTPLIGRTDELARIHAHFACGDTRLLTLTGPAGVGKTRLALQAAAEMADIPGRFPDGVVFVDLTPVRDPALVLNNLASALGLLDFGSQSLLERLQETLRDQRLLLVPDNFEHVLPAAASLAALLSTCPHVKLLVTSRVPLQLRWERTLYVPPLPVPDLSAPLPPLEQLMAIPSVALFLQRAVAHQADFVLTEKQAPLLARLTVQLDGLPLALELAAARTASLSLPAIAGRLEDRLQFLRWEARDMPERQQSLEAAVGWSYDLLSEPERRVFRCLGAFAGRVSLSAMLAVCGGAGDSRGNGAQALDRLSSLAIQSLIFPARSTDRAWQQDWSAADHDDDDETEPAFGMLETVRTYAEEWLSAAHELEIARQSHATYFLALAEQAGPELRGRDQRRWFLLLEREHDNLRAALRWLLEQADRAGREAGLRLAGALGYFWQVRRYHAEGRQWLEAALARASRGEEADAGVRLRALLPAGSLLAFGGKLDRALILLKEALDLAQQLQDPVGMVRALIYLGVSPAFAGASPDVPRLRKGLDRARKLGQPGLVGVSLFYLAMAEQAQGEIAGAASHYEEALDILDAAEDLHVAAGIRFGLGVILGQKGDVRGAAQQVQAGLATSVTLRDRWLLSQGARAALAVLGDGADPAEQARLLGAVEALRQATGSGRVVWERDAADHGGPELCQRLGHGEWAADYRQGRSLPAGAVAALALRMLNEFAGALGSSTPTTGTEPTCHPERVAQPPAFVARCGEHPPHGPRARGAATGGPGAFQQVHWPAALHFATHREPAPELYLQ